MTTKLASRTDPADLALATECIAWHVVHCAMCITGEVCGAAAENLAFLEGTDLYEVTAAALPAPRTPSAGAGGATSRRANPATSRPRSWTGCWTSATSPVLPICRIRSWRTGCGPAAMATSPPARLVT